MLVRLRNRRIRFCLMTTRNTHILQLARWGYHLVPWHARATPTSPSRPILTGWLEKKLTHEEVEVYTRIYPNADWAIVPQETVVLDLEHKHGLNGTADLVGLLNDCGLSWAEATSGCAQTRTKSGGLHLWFRQPHGDALVGGCHIRPSVECKSRNGSVHIPPSCGYAEVVRLGPPGELPALPGGLCALWRAACAKPTGNKEPLRTTFGDGERRLMLCRVAGRLRQHLAMNESELYAALLGVRDSRCENPSTFTDHEVRTIARDFARKSCDSYEALALAGDPFGKAAEGLFVRREPVRPDAAVQVVA